MGRIGGLLIRQLEPSATVARSVELDIQAYPPCVYDKNGLLTQVGQRKDMDFMLHAVALKDIHCLSQCHASTPAVVVAMHPRSAQKLIMDGFAPSITPLLCLYTELLITLKLARC